MPSFNCCDYSICYAAVSVVMVTGHVFYLSRMFSYCSKIVSIIYLKQAAVKTRYCIELVSAVEIEQVSMKT